MKRRSALIALACAWGGAGGAAGVRAAAAAARRRHGLGARGVLGRGRRRRSAPSAGRTGSRHRPRAHGPGVWLVTSTVALRRWEPDATVAVAVHGRGSMRPCMRWPPAPMAAGHWPRTVNDSACSMPGGEVVRTFDGIDLEAEVPRRRHDTVQPAAAAQLLRRLAGAGRVVGDLARPCMPHRSSTAWCTTTAWARAIATPGYLGARRAPLGRPMPVFGFADARVPWLAGMQGDEVVVVHLDVRRRIAALRVPGANPSRRRVARRPRAAAARTSGGCRRATRSMSSTPRAGSVWPGTRCPGRCCNCRPPTRPCGRWSASGRGATLFTPGATGRPMRGNAWAAWRDLAGPARGGPRSADAGAARRRSARAAAARRRRGGAAPLVRAGRSRD